MTTKVSKARADDKNWIRDENQISAFVADRGRTLISLYITINIDIYTQG